MKSDLLRETPNLYRFVILPSRLPINTDSPAHSRTYQHISTLSTRHTSTVNTATTHRITHQPSIYRRINAPTHQQHSNPQSFEHLYACCVTHQPNPSTPQRINDASTTHRCINAPTHQRINNPTHQHLNTSSTGQRRTRHQRINPPTHQQHPVH
jgi:hypothetical protein